MLHGPIREYWGAPVARPAGIGRLRVAGAFHHLAFGVHRGLIQLERSRRIHDAIIFAVADQHRAANLLCPALESVIAEHFAGVRQVARTDDPAHPLLNGRQIFEKILPQIVGTAAHKRCRHARLIASGPGHAIAAHADTLQADLLCIDVGSSLQIINHRLDYAIGIWRQM